jgi:phage terminase small subunit
VAELTNRRHEVFCQFMASGETTQAQAYEMAGYSASAQNASTMMKRPEIKARVEELKAEKERKDMEFQIALKKANLEPDAETKRQEITDWHVNHVRNMLAENARLAQVAGQFSAAKESIKLIGDTMDAFESGSKDGKKLEKPAAPSPVSISFINGAIADADEAPAKPASKNPLAPK